MKALIIDDERIARRELRRLLVGHSEIDIVGEAASGDEALVLIHKHDPDLLFLDIQMPGMTGFDLLDRLRDAPDVIFTTAYDQHALKAFEVNALDYLLKPIGAARLAAALERLRVRRSRSREQLFLREGERCWIVRIAEIELLESEGNYTRVFFRNEKPLIAGSLAVFENRIDTTNFFRASRKHIINLNCIQTAEAGMGGNLLVRMQCGEEVALSRRQSSHLKELLAF
jgi:two-component system LytT family response regulator